MDVQALLRLDILDRESLIADTVSNLLTKRVSHPDAKGAPIFFYKFSMPLTRTLSGHIYADIDTATPTRFTRSQLKKLHKQFFHPSAEKLFNLLQLARENNTKLETLTVLQDFSNRCDPCQHIKPTPTRFKVSFGAQNVRFNERVFLDIVTIDSRQVIHILDEGTHFSAALFLLYISIKKICSTVIHFCASIYTGLPNRMLVDQGTNFGNVFFHMGATSNLYV